MLTDVKKILETTGLKVAETCFKKTPQLPYIVFLDDISMTGSDYLNCIAYRDITVEFYSDKIDKDNEILIENILNENSIEFKKNRIWNDVLGLYQTIYDFSLIEKKGGK